MRTIGPVLGVALLCACSPRAAPSPTPHGSTSAAPSTTANLAAPAAAPDYAGRWTGVEGMFLDVRPNPQPGRFSLTMQYDLDHRETVVARLAGDTLEFSRKGEVLTLRPTDGAATGLKYLAGKRHCLTVKSGEGYCRD